MKKLFLGLFYILIVLPMLGQTPALNWVKSVKDTAQGVSSYISIDLVGNVYVVGSYYGTSDFNPGPGNYNLTSNGDADLFVMKLDSSGNFIWAKSVGSTSTDKAYSLALDSSGNCYITGFFNLGVDFDPGPGIYNLSTPSTSPYILELDVNGNFVWATQLPIGIYSVASGHSVKIGSAGSIYVAGDFLGVLCGLTAYGTTDAFVAKIDSSKNLVWIKQMGGNVDDHGNAIALDASENVFITGSFTSWGNFDSGSLTSTANLLSSGDLDIFICKLDSSGIFKWAKSMGGGMADSPASIILDEDNNIYTIGNFHRPADFDPDTGSYILTDGLYYSEVFISKLDSLGQFVLAKSISSLNSDCYGASVQIDSINNIYATGSFIGTADFDPGPGTYSLTSTSNGEDVFTLKWTSAGNFVWATHFGHTNYDFGRSIAIDRNNNIYTTGDFYNRVDFDPSSDTLFLGYSGKSFFILKMKEALITVDIREHDLNENVGVYPNPSAGQFQILIPELEPTFIEIYRSDSELIFKERLSEQSTNTIDIASQPKGIYFIKITRNSQIVATKKLIKI